MKTLENIRNIGDLKESMEPQGPSPLGAATLIADSTNGKIRGSRNIPPCPVARAANLLTELQRLGELGSPLPLRRTTMSYVLMYKIENADNWQWVFSSDGGQTQIVIETDTQADQPTDLDVRKQVNQGVPSSLKKAMATNARRNLRQAAERKRINNLVIRSYKLK